jgi:hypothetical protein
VEGQRLDLQSHRVEFPGNRLDVGLRKAPRSNVSPAGDEPVTAGKVMLPRSSPVEASTIFFAKSASALGENASNAKRCGKHSQ